MEIDITEIFERLLNVCKIKTLKDLSIKYEYQDHWATNTRRRGAIPWDLCLKVAIEYKLSLDYLIFGKESDTIKVNMDELKLSVTESVFKAIQTNMIELQEDVRISDVIEGITSDIERDCKIEKIKQQKVS